MPEIEETTEPTDLVENLRAMRSACIMLSRDRGYANAITLARSRRGGDDEVRLMCATGERLAIAHGLRFEIEIDDTHFRVRFSDE